MGLNSAWDRWIVDNTYASFAKGIKMFGKWFWIKCGKKLYRKRFIFRNLYILWGWWGWSIAHIPRKRIYCQEKRMLYTSTIKKKRKKIGVGEQCRFFFCTFRKFSGEKSLTEVLYITLLNEIGDGREEKKIKYVLILSPVSSIIFLSERARLYHIALSTSNPCTIYLGGGCTHKP